MKKIVAAVAATVALGIGCGVAFAEDPISKSLEMSGTVNEIGSLSGLTIDAGANVTTSGSTVNITTMAMANAAPKPFDFTASFDMVTNYNAKVKLFSARGGLRTSGVPINTSYTNYVEYTANAYVGSATEPVADTLLVANKALDAPISSEASQEFVAFSGKLSILVTAEAGLGTGNNEKKLIAGTYSDTLTVKVGSNL